MYDMHYISTRMMLQLGSQSIFDKAKKYLVKVKNMILKQLLLILVLINSEIYIFIYLHVLTDNIPKMIK